MSHEPSPSAAGLKTRLDLLYRRYGATFLDTDPICFPRRHADRQDQEVIGLVAACLAYGRVAQIKNSVERVARVLGPRPARFLSRSDPGRDRRLLRGFVHRFNDARDVGLLLHYVRQMLQECGSIEAFFLKGYSDRQGDIGPALASFATRTLALDCSPWYPSGVLPAPARVRFFLPSPGDGSTCKRLNLFLRWMVRPDDGVDMGLWNGVPPSKLVIPLDTHVSRISSHLGLTARRTVDWKMAIEVTSRLRELDPDDPVKYDFALCRLGILEGCPRHRDPARCGLCELRMATGLPSLS
ncbi:MAG TPA: TIGR02757 family protein [Candidatus Polarisedimenticolia bacterium]|jgi:uncharacterized protein (TIGR02757 family)